VSDVLWSQVASVRAAKTRGGGPRNSGRVDLLAGLIECVCGRRPRSDGTSGDGRHRKLHVDPCAAWGPSARLPDDTWEVAVLAQVAGITLDAATIAAVVATLNTGHKSADMDRARIERHMRELALEHVAERIGDFAYLAQIADLRQQSARLVEAPSGGVPAQRAIEWL